MKNRISLALLLTFFLIYAGCTSGRTTVMAVPTDKTRTDSVNLVEDQPTVNVPPEVTNMFRDKLDKALFVGDEGTVPPFRRGKELTIHYRFIQFTAGSQFKRWLAGGIGGYGEGSMIVEAKFITPDGKEINKIQSEGKIGAGIFGGTIDGAVDKCVEEIAKYTKQTFR